MTGRIRLGMVGGGRDAEVVVQLAIDVAEAPRQGPHVTVDGERQADRMPRRRVGVLPHDEHLHLGEGPGERPQHPVAGGQVVPTCGRLGAEPLAEGGDVGGDRFERRRPAGVDQTRGRQLVELPTGIF